MKLHHTVASQTERRKREAGFSGMIPVLVGVLVIIIGFTAWYVMHAKGQVDQTAQQSAASSTPTKLTSNTVVKTLYSKSPNDLQAAILAETTAAAPSCVKNGAIVNSDGKANDPIVYYVANGFAETAIGCDGSSATIFVKQTASWQKLGSTQFLFKCDDLKLYKVPVQFLKSVSPDPTEPAECASSKPGATASEVYTL